MVCHGLATFADALRAGSAEAKVRAPRSGSAPARCTPCRQRRGKGLPPFTGANNAADALRAGSAEAKIPYWSKRFDSQMHSVQAAPRQSGRHRDVLAAESDALRAGSAEAKRVLVIAKHIVRKMHSVQAAPRQSPLAGYGIDPAWRCTPCRQRRGKAPQPGLDCAVLWDALRAGSAEAKSGNDFSGAGKVDALRAGSAEAKASSSSSLAMKPGCTPCRQRRGKVWLLSQFFGLLWMHSVQAAPRQRVRRYVKNAQNQRDALRAGSAEAKVR